MRVLLDECLPSRLKRVLPGHEVSTVSDAGWAGKTNGELLSLAVERFDAFVTIDKNLPAQQNLQRPRIARSTDGRRPLIVHNVGAGPELADFLFQFPVTGHYRYDGSR